MNRDSDMQHTVSAPATVHECDALPRNTNAPVGDLRRHVIAPRHVADLCEACILRVAPAALFFDDDLGKDRERDAAGRCVWSHAEWTAYTPHVAS